MRVLLLLLSVLIYSCDLRVIPDGCDDKGFYKISDSCVSSHSERRTRTVMIGKVFSVQRYNVNVCDSSILTKQYIPIEKVKHTK